MGLITGRKWEGGACESTPDSGIYQSLIKCLAAGKLMNPARLGEEGGRMRRGTGGGRRRRRRKAVRVVQGGEGWWWSGL